MKAPKTAALLFAALVSVTGACSGITDDAAEEEAAFSSASEADTEANYILTDFKFEGPLTVTGPNVFFTAENKGAQDHELEILDSTGEAVGEVEAFAPGAEAKPVAAVLAPGTYTIQCILETPEGKVHKDLGMVAELKVE